MSGRLVFALAVAALLLGCGAGVARAHDVQESAPVAPSLVAGSSIRPAVESLIVAVTPDVALPLTLVAGLVLAGSSALAWRPRRALVLTIVPLLLLISFETGVHGVHHLGDARAAGECSVAVTTEHVAGAIADAPADPSPVSLPSSPLASLDTSSHAGQPFGSGDSRAPPVRSA